MAYLLDSQVLIWLANEPHKIISSIEDILMQKAEKIYFSHASIWEITIKSKLNKPDFNINAKKLYHHLLHNHYLELPINIKHCLKVYDLPMIHKDPFDRLLIAQAMLENLTFITHDGDILKYDNLKTLRA